MTGEDAKRKMMEDAELRRYAMGLLKSQAANLVATLLIAAISGRWLEILLFEAAFMTLRRYAGGYHSSSSTRCFFVSLGVLLAVVAGDVWVLCSPATAGAGSVRVLLLWGLAAGAFIFLFSPVEAINKPLDGTERRVYGRRARIVAAVQVAVEYILLLSGFKSAGGVVVLTHTAIVLSMLAGMWLQHAERAEKKNPQREGDR